MNIIETTKYINFCGGCNNQVKLQRFIAIDEGESGDEAVQRSAENKDDDLFKRVRWLGFCLCGNVFLFKEDPAPTTTK